jgi:hypothetical protein
MSVSVDEAFSSMQNRKVVDEVHVACQRLNLELCCLSDSFNHVQRLTLPVGNLWKMTRSWMSGISH